MIMNAEKGRTENDLGSLIAELLAIIFAGTVPHYFSTSYYFARASYPVQLYSNTMVHRQKRKKLLGEEDSYVFPGENQSSVSLHPLLFSPGLAHTGIHAVCISMLMEIKR